MDHCCYKWDEIFYHKYDTAEIIIKDVWPDNMDATIKKVKFGYELPGDKRPTREQHLASKVGFADPIISGDRIFWCKNLQNKNHIHIINLFGNSKHQKRNIP